MPSRTRRHPLIGARAPWFRWSRSGKVALVLTIEDFPKRGPGGRTLDQLDRRQLATPVGYGDGVTEVVVREATPDDVLAIAASSAGLFADDAGTRDRLRNLDWPRVHGEAWAAQLVADDSSLALVAIDSGGVVGHLAGAYYEPSSMWRVPRAELVSMRVADSHRGSGVGADLVGAFVAWAREKGAVRLQVDAYAANEGALRFYQHNGFTPHSIQLVQDLDPSDG